MQQTSGIDPASLQKLLEKLARADHLITRGSAGAAMSLFPKGSPATGSCTTGMSTSSTEHGYTIDGRIRAAALSEVTKAEADYENYKKNNSQRYKFIFISIIACSILSILISISIQ